jgi:NAD(P)H-dependent nitrite reductase small subunit
MNEGFTPIMRESEVPQGEGRLVVLGVKRLAVFNTEQGFFACDDECPHAGGSLSDGPVANCSVVCPLHFWEFDLRSGEYADDPTTVIQTYETKVIDGRVCVKL